jgi:hypothetical protein
MPRPRFSLLTTLLLTTIVGLAIVVTLFWREIGPLRAEVRRMRTELGFLTIDDPDRACAISVPTYEDDTWKWRIYLPVGGQYSLCTSSGHLPSRAAHPGNSWFDEVRITGSGMATNGGSFEGEILLEARLVKENDEWHLVTNYSGIGGSGIRTPGKNKESIYQPSGDWLSGPYRSTSSDVTLDQKSFEPGQSILLLHIVRPKITETPGGLRTGRRPQGSADGIAVWIEQQPPSPSAGGNSP